MKRVHIKDFTPEQIYGSGLKPDRNFSYEHNIRVLEETSRENYKRHFDLSEKIKKAAGDISDILAHYAKYTLDKGGGKKIDDYLGRELAKKLFGDRLNAKLSLEERIKAEARKQGSKTFYLN